MKIIILAAVMTLTCFSQAWALNDKDRGGGNAHEGRSIESYIQDPKNLKAYTDYIQPLRSRLSTGGLDPLFENVLNRKTWYFIPEGLPSLNGNEIGVPVTSSQVALQNFSSVWVDQKEFLKLSTEDQANILLHEVLMGIKLLRFQSLKEQCEAILFYAGTICDHQPQTRPVGKAALTPADYDDVRRTAFDIQNINSNLDEKGIENLLASRNFSVPFSPFKTKAYESGIPGEQILMELHQAYYSKNWPTQRYIPSQLVPKGSPHIIKPKGACQLSELVYNNGELTGTYISQVGSSNEKRINLRFRFHRDGFYEVNYLVSRPFDVNSKVWFVLQGPLAEKNPSQVSLGDRTITVEFFTDGVHVYESIVTYPGDQTGSEVGTVPLRDGINEYCSVKDQLLVVP